MELQQQQVSNFWRKRSCINKYMKSPADIELCISHTKLPLYEVYLLKMTAQIKAVIKMIYNVAETTPYVCCWFRASCGGLPPDKFLGHCSIAEPSLVCRLEMSAEVVASSLPLWALCTSVPVNGSWGGGPNLCLLASRTRWPRRRACRPVST